MGAPLQAQARTVLVNLLIAAAIIFALHSVIKWAARTSPAQFANLIRRAGGRKGMADNLFTFLRKQGAVGMALSALGEWWLNRPSDQNFSTAGAGRTRRLSRVETATLEMELDLDTGAMTGVFRKGPFAGRALEKMSQAEVTRALEAMRGSDGDAAKLLEAYLDRAFAGGGFADEAQSDAGGAGGRARSSGALTEKEAYEILGLRPGATRDDITRAHRSLMKKFHPDNGGSAHEAARLNEARDFLLRRHG